jgi:DNA (cytosine-5)-methyltransferase 1
MTISASADNGNFRWMYERPATTVAGDPRLSPPGWRGKPDDYDADGTYTGARSMDNAIRLTIREALILQSFAADYPVAGTRTAQFRQVGDAFPPVLAAAVLACVLPETSEVAA